MNEADKLLVQQIKTKPWRELSCCGASITEKLVPGRRAKDPEITVLDIHLAWVEGGEMADEYHVEMKSSMNEEEVAALLSEIAAFARGAVPVSWGAHSKAVLWSFLEGTPHSLHPIDTSLCFLLRKKSRWLDPMIWSYVRTRKAHEMDVILKAVGLVKSHSRAIDVAALAYQLPTRDGFPVRPEWTASETADWQELQQVF